MNDSEKLMLEAKLQERAATDESITQQFVNLYGHHLAERGHVLNAQVLLGTFGLLMTPATDEQHDISPWTQLVVPLKTESPQGQTHITLVRVEFGPAELIMMQSQLTQCMRVPHVATAIEKTREEHRRQDDAEGK